MANRTTKTNKTLTYISALLGLIAVLAIFLPAFQYGDESFTGVQTAFGYTEKTDGIISISANILKINYLSLIAYMLPIAGIVAALIGKKSGIINSIGIAAFVGAGVCAFFSVTTFPETVIGSGWISFDWELAYGMIISGACSLAAGCALVVKSATK